MKDAKLLLEKITEAFPPGLNMKHNFTVDDGYLVLSLMVGDGRYYPLRFQEKDLTRAVDDLVKEITDLIRGVQ